MRESILRIKDVKSVTGLSNTTIYNMIKEGSFPRPIPIGLQAKGWLSSEVDDWIKSRIYQRKAA